MSYILDALRRAERERERGLVPGLHAQVEPVGLGEGTQAPARRQGRLVLAGIATALVVVLALWWWSGRSGAGAVPADVASAGASGAVPVQGDAPARSTDGAPASRLPTAGQAPTARPDTGAGAGPTLLVAPPAPPAAPAAPAPATGPPPPNATNAPTARTAAAPKPTATQGGDGATVPGPTTAGAPSAVPAERAMAPTPARAALPTAAPRPPAATAPAANPVAAANGPVPAAAAAAGKPTLLSDLPAGQRAELPQMLVGGAIYSDQASSRFVVINGIVVREGETAAPGVVMERIGPKSAVIRWREMRIELPF